MVELMLFGLLLPHVGTPILAMFPQLLVFVYLYRANYFTSCFLLEVRDTCHMFYLRHTSWRGYSQNSNNTISCEAQVTSGRASPPVGMF